MEVVCIYFVGGRLAILCLLWNRCKKITNQYHGLLFHLHSMSTDTVKPLITDSPKRGQLTSKQWTNPVPLIDLTIYINSTFKPPRSRHLSTLDNRQRPCPRSTSANTHTVQPSKRAKLLKITLLG